MKMKTKKLISRFEELQARINTNEKDDTIFQDAWDLSTILFYSVGHDYEVIKSNNMWITKLNKITVVKKGRGEVDYKSSYVLKETGNTIPQSIVNASLKLLKG